MMNLNNMPFKYAEDYAAALVGSPLADLPKDYLTFTEKAMRERDLRKVDFRDLAILYAHFKKGLPLETDVAVRLTPAFLERIGELVGAERSVIDDLLAKKAASSKPNGLDKTFERIARATLPRNNKGDEKGPISPIITACEAVSPTGLGDYTIGSTAVRAEQLEAVEHAHAQPEEKAMTGRSVIGHSGSLLPQGSSLISRALEQDAKMGILKKEEEPSDVIVTVSPKRTNHLRSDSPRKGLAR
ncbi:MAG: hypothetical protein PHS57_04010 [Alphaproteobacteria bacterium]|nr:hypothetical protein [Alphaproteobacteria bacterium]